MTSSSKVMNNAIDYDKKKLLIRVLRFSLLLFFQLESLFSNPYYVKPQRPSVSSLYGPGGGDRKNSYEVIKSFSSL